MSSEVLPNPIAPTEAETAAPSAGGHQLIVEPGYSEAFPLTRTEVDRFCRRLRNIAEPIISHETWAAALFGSGIALYVARATLPSASVATANHVHFLQGVFEAGWIASGVGFVMFALLAIGDRRRKKKSDANLVADELEDICEERMKKREEAAKLNEAVNQ